MRQVFQVGEEVILQSLTYPELNGECVVLSVVENDDNLAWKDGKLVDVGTHYMYKTSVGSNYWSEIALRKKHEPSDDSFSQLMDKLKIGETV